MTWDAKERRKTQLDNNNENGTFQDMGSYSKHYLFSHLYNP